MTKKKDGTKKAMSSLEDLVALNPVATVKGKVKMTDGASAINIFLDPGLELLVRVRVAQICNCGWIVQQRDKEPQVEAVNRIFKSWQRQVILSNREIAALNIALAFTRNPINNVPDNAICVVRVFFQTIVTASVTLVILGTDDWRYLNDSLLPNSLFS